MTPPSLPDRCERRRTVQLADSHLYVAPNMYWFALHVAKQ
jgi:hypothetical protein